jgi:hypothetical protein
MGKVLIDNLPVSVEETVLTRLDAVENKMVFLLRYDCDYL